MQPERGDVESAFRFMTWDWKDQPNLQELAELANSVAAGGRVFVTYADTEGDQFGIVISNVLLDEDEATGLFSEWRDEG